MKVCVYELRQKLRKQDDFWQLWFSLNPEIDSDVIYSEEKGEAGQAAAPIGM